MGMPSVTKRWGKNQSVCKSFRSKGVGKDSLFHISSMEREVERSVTGLEVGQSLGSHRIHAYFDGTKN